MKKISFLGWENCVHLTNQQIELVVTSDVGPRVIYFGFVGEDNLLATLPQQLGSTGGDEWKVYGGHRLWLAPEQMPRTYFPDNAPVEVEDHGSFVRFTAPVESSTRIQKVIDIALDPHTAAVQLRHTLHNHSPWAVTLAPWALTVMAPGGTAVFPLPPRGTHPENLAPTGGLALWAYTNLADPRWTLGERSILLRQDASQPNPQKIGGINTAGWLGYVNNGRFFVKHFPSHRLQAAYPDLNCSAQIFTNQEMLELESLGPLETLAPGAQTSHEERWRLFSNVPAPQNDEDVVVYLLPKIEE